MFKMRKGYGKPIFLKDFKIHFGGYQEVLTTVFSLFLKRAKKAHDISNFLVCIQISSILRIVLYELKTCLPYRVVISCRERKSKIHFSPWYDFIKAPAWLDLSGHVFRWRRKQWWPLNWLNTHCFHGLKQSLTLCSMYFLATCIAHSLSTLFLFCLLSN